MLLCRFHLCFLLVFAASTALGASETLDLPVHTHKVLEVPGIRRVAVASRSILGVRAVPPEQVLLTGRREGETVVTLWTQEHYRTLLVRVLPPSGNDGASVARIRLEFLELEQNFLSDLGIDWPEQRTFSVDVQGPPWGVNLSTSFGSLDGLLKTLVSEGWANVVARPELFVRLGESARFHAGGEIPVPGTAGAYGNYYSRITWKPFGMSVKVLPRRRSGDDFRCEIDVEISELSGQVLENVPGISSRRVQTEVDLRDGETILLSGLVKRNGSFQKRGVAGLSRLPLVGLFFGSDEKRRRETELLLALNLSLVHRKEGQAQLEALRDQMNGSP
ncbi:MAG: pilus assembly protein N-terminal domain-containing protein [Bdellovibrionaceae bacterium]|nr:pilus assembly protein N-terminal domain-containing protein [Pseudobdellovibrionaceae bacterium]